MQQLEQELLQFISEKPTYEQIIKKFDSAGINLISICLDKLQGDKKVKPRITFELVESEELNAN
jgi:hypothetical protein